MEKATLKSIIIGLKMSGLSFAEIAIRLKEDYEVDMSRQAVCGMYNRAMSKDSGNNSVAMAVMTTDVCRYSSLGLTPSNIKEVIEGKEYNLTVNQIKTILKNNGSVINEMIDSYVELAVNDIESFEDKLEFDGVKPTVKTVYFIKEKATEEILLRNSKNILKSLLNSGVDKTIIKHTAKRFNIANSISELMH